MALGTTAPSAPLISQAPTMCWGFNLLPHGLPTATRGGQIAAHFTHGAHRSLGRSKGRAGALTLQTWILGAGYLQGRSLGFILCTSHPIRHLGGLTPTHPHGLQGLWVPPSTAPPLVRADVTTHPLVRPCVSLLTASGPPLAAPRGALSGLPSPFPHTHFLSVCTPLRFHLESSFLSSPPLPSPPGPGQRLLSL